MIKRSKCSKQKLYLKFREKKKKILIKRLKKKKKLAKKAELKAEQNKIVKLQTYDI